MATLLRSLITAACFAAATYLFVLEVVAPQMPPYTGPADVSRERTLRFPAPQRVSLDSRNGSVRVNVSEAGEAAECVVQARIRLYDLEDRARRDLDALASTLVAAEHEGDVLSLRSVPETWPENVAAIVDYELTVRRGTDIEIDGLNGNVWVAEGCGEVRIESGNADVEIDRPEGSVLARSKNGRMRLRGGDAPCTLETVNGDIEATMLGGALSATSVNGHVRANIEEAEVRAFVLTSENGNVRVGIPPRLGFALDAVAPRGGVRGVSDLPQGESASGAYHGQVGDGSTLLTLSTANGSIRLVRE